MKKLFVIILLVCAGNSYLGGQHTEIDGKLKVTKTDTLSAGEHVLALDSNGYLAEVPKENLIIQYFLSLPNGPQLLLQAGESPAKLIANGVDTSDLYGLKYQGGLIFLINDDGSGYVAAPSDFPNPAEWGCFGIEITTGESIGDGLNNTDSIVSNPCSDPGNAAEICFNLTIEGYSDWFLPSRNELMEMYNNIGKGNDNMGDFEDNFYWSSSNNSSIDTFTIHFESGLEWLNVKTSDLLVRAIRKFAN